MGRRYNLIYKVGAIIFIFAIFYNEFIIYAINSWTWSQLKCKNEGNCLKILLVADPQLIGERNENFHFLTPLSIWDSDRFLRKTYTSVVDHLSPDVVIFLGDLLDEGSIASSIQYIRYLQRLFSIFTTGYPIKHIWIPGDNDIGGESDQVTEDKIKRFEHAFSQPSVIDVKHVRFTKVNRMIRNPSKSFDFENNYNNIDQKLSVVISHMPLVSVPGLIVDKVIDNLKPKIIFAAHEHKARVIQTNIWQHYRNNDNLKKSDNQIYEYKLDKNKIIEILVPTCSYRMGTFNIGYGAAIIEKNETVQYTIFWSPNRFFHLLLYVLLLVLIIMYVIIGYICKKFNKPRIICVSKSQYPYKIIKNGV